MSLFRNVGGPGILLAVFSLIGVGLVAGMDALTAKRIADNQRQAVLETLAQVLPAALYDNDLLADRVFVDDWPIAGRRHPTTVYRARQGGRAVAAVFATVAPEGYNGDIELLVAVDIGGAVLGVRVTGHRETPGLGDHIESARSDWITHFAGHKLGDPPASGWAVKKDGGRFDQFTGATITPRAVVKSVKRTLEFFARHRVRIFATDPDAKLQLDKPA